MARRILTVIVNNAVKNKYIRDLKENFRTYGHPEKIAEIGIQKALKIPQPTALRQPKTIEKNSNLAFICTFNPNSPKLVNLIKSGVNTLAENGVNGIK